MIKRFFSIFIGKVFEFICRKFRNSLFKREYIIIKKEYVEKEFGITLNIEEIHECHDLMRCFGYDLRKMKRPETTFKRVKNKKEFSKLKNGSLILFVKRYSSGKECISHSAIKVSSEYIFQTSGGIEKQDEKFYFTKPFNYLMLQNSWFLKDDVDEIWLATI